MIGQMKRVNINAKFESIFYFYVYIMYICLLQKYLFLYAISFTIIDFRLQ